MSVEITYERVPPMCKQCKTFGHIDAQCPPKGAWTSKVKTTEEEKEAKTFNVEEHSNTSMPMGENKAHENTIADSEKKDKREPYAGKQQQQAYTSNLYPTSGAARYEEGCSSNETTGVRKLLNAEETSKVPEGSVSKTTDITKKSKGIREALAKEVTIC